MEDSAFFEEKEHKSKGTMTRLVEYISANPVPAGHIVHIAKSGVDKEFADAVGLNRSQYFPEGSIPALGIKFKLDNDYHTEPEVKNGLQG